MHIELVAYMKKIVIDLDGTLTIDGPVDYKNKLPNMDVVQQLIKYKSNGYYIVINTARNMKTFSGSVGLINVKTLPIILEWLESNNIPFDEVIVGKPWCGEGGFYVDDRAIRPSEFVSLTETEIQNMLMSENSFEKSGQI